MARLIEWLWRLLPDRCEVCGGTRGGVRGNENIADDVRLCDYCHADHIRYPRFWGVKDGE